jgi:hypothetical protein
MVDKLNKNAEKLLSHSLKTLEQIMTTAVEKDDLDAQLAVVDRLMLLYQHQAEKNTRKFKPGFGLTDPMKEDDDTTDSD